MGCKAKMMQIVPTKYDWKEVPAVCGQTSIYGTELLCQDCLPPDADIKPFGSQIYDSYGDGGYTQFFIVTLPSATDMDGARQAVNHLLDRRCYCEHDCCGHYNGGAYIKKRLPDFVKPNTYLAIGHYSPNY